MKPKKTQNANLENRKSMHFLLGLIVSLSLMLISFEWTTLENDSDRIAAASSVALDMEEIISTVRERPPEPKKPELPQVIEVLNIVEDDVVLDDIILIDELSPDTRVDFVFPPNEPIEVIDEPTHWFVQIMPQFNGGDPGREFSKFIARSLKYPEEAAEMGVKGRVIVSFVIDKKGNLVEASIMKGVHPALDEEALRVLGLSPKWEPGLQEGRYVRVAYTFPINFVLQ